VAGGVYQACSIAVRRAGLPVVGEVVGAIALRAMVSHHRSQASGDWGGWSAMRRWSPQSGQRPSCLASRRRLKVSSGGLTRRRRVAQ
jgi:hypothetical protein